MTQKTKTFSKDDFCRIIHQLQAADDLRKKINNLIFTAVDVESDFLSGYGMTVDHAGLVIELLERVMKDEEDTIGWWIYESDYGRDENMHIYIDHEPVDLSDAAKLYDFLIQEAKD